MSDSRVVLVTGVSGFLGRYVARELFEQGWVVVGIARERRPLALETCLAAYYAVSLPDTALTGIIERHAPTLCIHCAGGASVDDSMRNPHTDFGSGPVVTFDLLDTLRRLAPRCRVVFLSSAAVYGNPGSLPILESQPCAPISPYGFHKLQCEQLCTEFSRVYGMHTAIARIFSAYGAGLRKQVLWDLSRRALERGRLTLRGTGSETRDFMHARDVARGLSTIAERGSMEAAVYNLASGEETSIRSIAAHLLDAMDIEQDVAFDGVIPAGSPTNWRADIDKVRGIGFTAKVPLREGIASFADWCRTERDK